jgi:glucose-6-phosphate 1-dehydrogenase
MYRPRRCLRSSRTSSSSSERPGTWRAETLLPGLLHLSQTELISDFAVVGTSLEELDDAGFRELAKRSAGELARHPVSPDELEEFARRLFYVNPREGSEGLAAAVAKAEAQVGGMPRRLLHLSVPPAAAADVVHFIGDAGLAERARVIMEKPFGMDLASASALNASIHEVFDEDQIFRIDHFLGKEAAQNILALRFANGLFEPIWNRNHIDHVQIDVPETLDVGTRIEFYEKTGAYRDMVVTHLFQVLAFVAMEPPTALAPVAIGEEKNKVFRSLRPIDVEKVVRGQYEGYRSHPGVDPDSRPRRSSRSSAASTTGAGPGCRSTCAPASEWPSPHGSSRSRFASLRRACSPTDPASANTGPITSPSTSTSRLASRSRSTASAPAR